MFDFGPELLEIVFRTFIVYVVVVVGLRIFGKRELGQMNAFDLVLILTLSNAVQNAMTGPNTSLTGGIVSASTLLATNWLFARLRERIPWLRKWVEGEPTLLVDNGHIFYDHMKEEGVDMDELLMAARQHEVERVADIKRAVLEVDGTISVIPKEEGSSKGVPGIGRRKRRVHR
jgi:uncharacterized membrane protein YcaP (DUF421 family)